MLARSDSAFSLTLPSDREILLRRVFNAPRRLVFEACNEALVTVSFAERHGKTTLTSLSLYPSREDRDGHLNSGMEAGAAEVLERLAQHLATMA